MHPSNQGLPKPAPLPTNADEAELLRQVAARDPCAFELLYRNYYRRLKRFLQLLTRKPQLTDEILDDTMLVVWQKAETYNGTSRVSTWIFAIAYKKALKALKREHRSEESLPEDEMPSTVHSPETDFIERESGLGLKRLVATLSLEQRAVVELTYYHGCSYKEIAAIVGCPVNTVKTRMFHAHRKLRAILITLGAESGRDAPLSVR